MGSSLNLGKVLGIPLAINYTWFIVFFLITASLALGQFPHEYPLWSPAEYWTLAVITSLLFFGSVLVHELTHSVIALANGIPVKNITLYVFGGVSQIAREATSPLSELVMAAAGPASSLVIAGLFWGLGALVGKSSQHLAALTQWLANINLVLGIFNLVPGFPLDGGRVLRSTIWLATGNYGRATRLATMAGQGIAYLFIFMGIIMIFTGNWVSGLWIAFIGWFLENAASSSYRQAVLREALQGYTARDVMAQDCALVPRGMSMGELVRDHILRSSRRCFFVASGERLEGMVTLHNIKNVPQDRWDSVTVGEAMIPLEKLKVARPTEDALAILERMDEGDINQMPVVEDGKVLGMIGRDNLLHFIRTRAELGM